jgi:hypothetical protein
VKLTISNSYSRVYSVFSVKSWLVIRLLDHPNWCLVNFWRGVNKFGQTYLEIHWAVLYQFKNNFHTYEYCTLVGIVVFCLSCNNGDPDGRDVQAGVTDLPETESANQRVKTRWCDSRPICQDLLRETAPLKEPFCKWCWWIIIRGRNVEFHVKSSNMHHTCKLFLVMLQIKVMSKMRKAWYFIW